jgi:hypothetical protein
MDRVAVAVLAALALAADSPKPIPPVNLPVNTAADEDDPHVSSDNRVLYYASNAKGKFDLMVARRAKATLPWGKGETLQDYVQTEADDRSPFATAEGRFPQFLYYATKLDKDGTNFDLYYATKQGPNKAFAEPRALTNLSEKDGDELHPWLSADGKELYFSRKGKDGWRVWVARRKAATGPAGFGDPTLVEGLPLDFHHATLTPDGRTMYLQGPLGKNRWGLFSATRTAKGWNKPEALEGLNDPEAPTGDRSPALSRDGTRLYFASDRTGGKGGLDLWGVEVTALRRR